MPNLSDLKGQKIIIHLLHPIIEQKQPILITQLIDIEPNGIWIEGTDVAEYLQTALKQPLLKTPVFFVPFAQIGWISSSVDYPYLSEKSLGLKNP
jgi:hypothetical protein